MTTRNTNPKSKPNRGQKRKLPNSSDKNQPPAKRLKASNDWKETMTKINKMVQEYNKLNNDAKKARKGLKRGEETEKSAAMAKKALDSAEQIFEKVQGQLWELARRRAGSVSIQTLLKVAPLSERIFEELKPHLTELCANTYGVHVVLALLRCGDNIRKQVVDFVAQNADQMLALQEPCRVVNEIFDNGKAMEKKLIMRAFYGSERHTDEITALLEKHSFSECSLTQYCKELEPSKTFHIVKHLSEVVTKAVNKELLSPFPVLHYLTNEALNLVTPDKVRFLVSDILEQLVHIVHTPHGRDLAVKCLYFGRNKERKVIMKEFKRFALPGSKDANASLVMCALLDVTDDTRKSFESVFKPLMGDLGELLQLKSACQLFMFPFAPCNKYYYSPAQIESIRPTLRDDIYDKESSNYDVHKKPKEEIHHQLSEKLFAPLMQELTAFDADMFAHAHLLQLVMELVRYNGEPAQSEEAAEWRSRVLTLVGEGLIANPDLIKDTEYQKVLKEMLKLDVAAPLRKVLTSHISDLSAKELEELVFDKSYGVLVAGLMKNKDQYKKLKKCCKPFIDKIRKADKKNYSLQLLAKVYDEPKF